MDNVRKLITEADGYQPHLIAPEQGYRRLIEATLVTIKGPADSAVDAVYTITHSAILQYYLFKIGVSKNSDCREKLVVSAI